MTKLQPNMESFKKKDSQDDGNIKRRKHSKLPKSRGKVVDCFHCYESHFSICWSLNMNFEELEGVQVKITCK